MLKSPNKKRWPPKKNLQKKKKQTKSSKKSPTPDLFCINQKKTLEQKVHLP